jgi:mono/diheme cytochrome c family protein
VIVSEGQLPMLQTNRRGLLMPIPRWFRLLNHFSVIITLWVAVMSTPPVAAQETNLIPDVDNGSVIYDHACAMCHGETGQGVVDLGPALQGSDYSLTFLLMLIESGKGTMPSFSVLTQQQLLDVSTFLMINMNVCDHLFEDQNGLCKKE